MQAHPKDRAPGSGLLGFKLALLVAIAVVSLATGEGIDVGGLFFPLTVVLLLVVTPPIAAAVISHYRITYSMAGVVIAVMSTLGMAVGDPTVPRVMLAMLCFVAGMLLIVTAVSPQFADRFPWVPAQAQPER